jgi:hypothetical protein
MEEKGEKLLFYHLRTEERPHIISLSFQMVRYFARLYPMYKDYRSEATMGGKK